ncbi:MAG: tRNA uridine-5-carboxymethylaminomethyl(34) synthesis GTPase MnmE [Bacteroidia bacterium]
MFSDKDTIVAISTPPGFGALGVLRLSGKDAISIADKVFSKKLANAIGHSLHYGRVKKNGEILDEAVAAVFKGPKSFTREDTVEFSLHGSPYILREALQLMVDSGARLAEPGEFTQRAFLNGGLDLAQAEAVADLIASTSSGAHKLALQQLRGGVSNELKDLREQLLNFTSLIELELDFGEEDVEFADRTKLRELVDHILERIDGLAKTFSLGNALKQGLPTVILGKPNAGKSTLLNALLNDDRAIVSDIAGTTRDVIEDRVVIEGVEFRLQDTAGVRETTDVIEAEGVTRAVALARKADLVIYLFDLQEESAEQAAAYITSLELADSTTILLVANKIDLKKGQSKFGARVPYELPNGHAVELLRIAAKGGQNLDLLRQAMADTVTQLEVYGGQSQAIISNVRHLNALQHAGTHLREVITAIDSGLPPDLMTIDIRSALHHIGEITGEISTDEVLGNIFSKFCIGK